MSRLCRFKERSVKNSLDMLREINTCFVRPVQLKLRTCLLLEVGHNSFIKSANGIKKSPWGSIQREMHVDLRKSYFRSRMEFIVIGDLRLKPCVIRSPSSPLQNSACSRKVCCHHISLISQLLYRHPGEFHIPPNTHTSSTHTHLATSPRRDAVLLPSIFLLSPALCPTVTPGSRASGCSASWLWNSSSEQQIVELSFLFRSKVTFPHLHSLPSSDTSDLNM